MPIELAGIQLNRVHHIETLEQGSFVYHRIPGAQGNVAQNMGRDSVCLQLQGIFYGPTAQEELTKLRQVYQKRQAVDFLADIVGQAYFSQVILDRFEVVQSVRDPDQFSYVLTITEFVKPASPPPTRATVNAAIKADAANFLAIATLPDTLKMGALPEVTNPIAPLTSAIAPVQAATQHLDAAATGLKALFNL
jgi:hypothetical protein